MNAHRCAPFLTALFLVSSGAFGAPVRVKDSGISFVAKANVGLVIEGTTSALLVSEDAKNVTLVVELGGLTTGVDLRDKHMRERYLEVPKFPTASLVIEKACLALPEAGDKSGECAGGGGGDERDPGVARDVDVHPGEFGAISVHRRAVV